MTETVSEPSIGARTVVSAGWIIVWRMSTRLLGIVSTVVLVRLLLPGDFGLVSLATAFADAMSWLTAIGVQESLVREDAPDREMYSTAFTIHLIKGAFIGGAILVGAEPLAVFFQDPRLFDIMLVIAITNVMACLENIGIVDFRRNLSFNRDFQLALLPRIVSIVVSILFALIFRNYWALIAGILTNRLLRLFLSYWMHPFRPSLTLRAWRKIASFSWWTWVSAIVIMLRDRSDAFVIGRNLGAAQVGIYSVGWEIGSLTSTELVEPAAAALFAGFSVARRTGSDLADGYFRAISMILMLTLPMGVGLSLVASPVIQLAFGQQWLDAIPLVQIFALACTVRVIAYISSVLLSANGMIHMQFRILVAGLIVRLILLFTLIGPFGLIGAAVGVIGCVAVEESLFLVVTFRTFKLRPFGLVRSCWRSVVATIAMAGALLLEGSGWSTADGPPAEVAIALAVGVVSGALIYGAVLAALWFLSGRPKGAESTALDIASKMIGRLARR